MSQRPGLSLCLYKQADRADVLKAWCRDVPAAGPAGSPFTSSVISFQPSKNRAGSHSPHRYPALPGATAVTHRNMTASVTFTLHTLHVYVHKKFKQSLFYLQLK